MMQCFFEYLPHVQIGTKKPLAKPFMAHAALAAALLLSQAFAFASVSLA